MVFIARFQYIAKNHSSGFERIRSILMTIVATSLGFFIAHIPQTSNLYRAVALALRTALFFYRLTPHALCRAPFFHCLTPHAVCLSPLFYNRVPCALSLF